MKVIVNPHTYSVISTSSTCYVCQHIYYMYMRGQKQFYCPFTFIKGLWMVSRT
jgi:pyrrolidone-carboxylate peptidase